MVSSILPGAAGANALGVDTRFTRAPAQGAPRREDAVQTDRVEVTGAALAAARESVREGLAQIHQALAVGHDAQSMLVKVQELARNGGAQAELAETLEAYAQRADGAVAAGAGVVAGQEVVVQAEPGAAPVIIAGADLRLKQTPAARDVIAVSADAQVTDAGLAQAAQKSLENLQQEMGRLLDSARSLEAHQGFLGAAELGARGDLDADGARLTALQVRQGLEKVGGAAIANVEPQAVLSLFRA